MTWRSVLLGLAGAAAICGVTFINDRVLKGTYLIGNNMPIAIYGTVVLFVVLLNPLLQRLALSGREIAVIMTLTLAACCIPSSGLLRTFTDVLIMPGHFEKTQPGWAGGAGVLSDADVADWPRFLAALRGDQDEDGPGRALWSSLSEGVRARIAAEVDAPSPDLRAAVRDEINVLIRNRSWPSTGDLARVDLPEHVQRFAGARAGDLTPRQVEILGRTTLEVTYAGHVVPRRIGVLETVPAGLLLEPGVDEDRVVGGFVQGMGVGTQHIDVTEVPWRAWAGVLAFWVPLILVLLGAIVALSVVVHRQWSKHELLPYPIAQFTDALLPSADGDASERAPVMRNNLFWLGALIVLAIHLVNYTFQWFPRYMFSIPVGFDFSGLSELFPTIAKGGGWFVFHPRVFFIVIGLAYFVANDVSLSFAVGPVLWALVVGLFAGYGISLQAPEEGAGYWMSASPRLFIVFGACLGVFLTLAYTGRRYYASVALRAFGRQAHDEVSAAEIWAFRAFLGLSVVFALMLAIGTGVGLVYAILYTVIAIIGFVVTSRVIAETGLFHIQIMVFPCIILWGLFGARMVGVRTLLILQIVSAILFIDPRESLMPYLTNSLKLLERRALSLGRPALFAALALVVGLAVGIPVTLYIQYDKGLTQDYWAEQMVPKMPFDNAVALRYKHEAQGVTTAGSTVATETGLKPLGSCVWALVVGLVLVVAFTVARLRLTWWPLHPLMFALWATNHVQHFAWSFFIGWMVKIAIVKYGGNHMYDRLKPLMVGLVAGEVLGAFVPCIVGVVYWLMTGELPKAFSVLPG